MAKKGGAPENLIPFNKRSEEDAARIRKLGNKASTEAKRRRKTLREWAKALGNELLVNSNGDKMERDGILVLQLYNKALKGDTRAATFIAKLLGEMFDTQVNVTQEEITLEIE